MSEPDAYPAAATREQAPAAGQPGAVLHDQRGLSPGLVRLMAVTCAVTVANLMTSAACLPASSG
jgi:hypothetical protein